MATSKPAPLPLEPAKPWLLNATFDAQPELRQAASQIVGLMASGLAGGDLEKASWVALMADEYNRQLHQKETVALEQLQKESPEKAYELKAAACALVHCAASVPPEDSNYQAVRKLEADGKGFKDAQSALFATGAFDEYSKWDQVNDDLLLNDKNLKQSGRVNRAVLGAVGASAGFGGAILTTPACVSGVGCAIPAFSALGGAASFVDGWRATGELFAPYDYTQGSKVLASFDSATYPGDVNPLRDYGTEAAKAALEIALLKGTGKYLEGTGATVLVSGVKKDGAGVVGGAKETVAISSEAASVNAQAALRAKLSGLQKAQQTAAVTKTLPDGRIRYYTQEVPARTEGATRGASFATEYNPATGSTRQWMESYDHSGNVIRVHPKSINGQPVSAQHYPPTGAELESWK